MTNHSEVVPRLAGLLLGVTFLLFALYIATAEDVLSLGDTAEVLVFSGLGFNFVGIGLSGTTPSRRLIVLGGALFCLAFPLLGIASLVKKPDTGGDDFIGVLLILLGAGLAANWKWRD